MSFNSPMFWIKNKYFGILDSLCFDVVNLHPMEPRPVSKEVVGELYSYLILWSAVLASIISCIYDFFYSANCINWFPRMGALLVGASIAVTHLKSYAAVEYTTPRKVKKRRECYSLYAAIEAISGTIIWGFGDWMTNGIE